MVCSSLTPDSISPSVFHLLSHHGFGNVALCLEERASSKTGRTNSPKSVGYANTSGWSWLSICLRRGFQAPSARVAHQAGHQLYHHPWAPCNYLGSHKAPTKLLHGNNLSVVTSPARSMSNAQPAAAEDQPTLGLDSAQAL